MKHLRCAIALLLAGSALFLGGWGTHVRKGVVVNGVPVGGMSHAAACEALRTRFPCPPFVLHTPAGEERVPVVCKDDLEALLRGARQGEYTFTRRYELPDAEQYLMDVCRKNVLPAVDATLSFSRRGFSYTPGREGRACDYAASLSALLAALREGRGEATLVTRSLPPAVTERDLRARTRPLATFSTAFSEEKTARVHNISLACERITGTVLAPGEQFSFNACVGERTRENGFLDATVIVSGAFTEGTGGGVCQVSTTLMGAALRAGLRITNSRPHSLAVGYVPPSQDAMVSSASDLCFCNVHPFPVYILGRTGRGEISFTVYGMPDGRRYELESRVLERIPPPAEEVREGEEDRVIRAAKEGIRSECYLLTYEGEKLLSRTLLRRDSYAPVQGIVEKKRAEQPLPERIFSIIGRFF